MRDWVDQLAERLDPAPEPPKEGVVLGLLPLMNLFRKAVGEPELTADEELARAHRLWRRLVESPEERQREAAWRDEVLAKARARVAAEEASLRDQ